MPNNEMNVEQELKKIQILLAGLMLKEGPRPNVAELESFIGVRKGTLSELFPQRKPKTSDKTTATAGEVNR